MLGSWLFCLFFGDRFSWSRPFLPHPGITGRCTTARQALQLSHRTKLLSPRNKVLYTKPRSILMNFAKINTESKTVRPFINGNDAIKVFNITVEFSNDCTTEQIHPFAMTQELGFSLHRSHFLKQGYRLCHTHLSESKLTKEFLITSLL